MRAPSPGSLLYSKTPNCTMNSNLIESTHLPLSHRSWVYWQTCQTNLHPLSTWKVLIFFATTVSLSFRSVLSRRTRHIREITPAGSTIRVNLAKAQTIDTSVFSYNRNALPNVEVVLHGLYPHVGFSSLVLFLGVPLIYRGDKLIATLKVA